MSLRQYMYVSFLAVEVFEIVCHSSTKSLIFAVFDSMRCSFGLDLGREILRRPTKMGEQLVLAVIFSFLCFDNRDFGLFLFNVFAFFQKVFGFSAKVFSATACRRRNICLRFENFAENPKTFERTRKVEKEHVKISVFSH